MVDYKKIKFSEFLRKTIMYMFFSSPKDKNIVFSLSRSEVKAASQLTENYLAFKDI